MTAEEFVKAVKTEKEKVMAAYFSDNVETETGKIIHKLINSGTSEKDLYKLLDLILNENCYNFLLALDGESCLGGIQMSYKLYDPEENELTGSGDIESEAFEQFIA